VRHLTDTAGESVRLQNFQYLFGCVTLLPGNLFVSFNDSLDTAKIWADLGVPAHTLKDLMGHSSVTTTMEFYVKSIDANRRVAVEKLNSVAIVS